MCSNKKHESVADLRWSSSRSASVFFFFPSANGSCNFRGRLKVWARLARSSSHSLTLS